MPHCQIHHHLPECWIRERPPSFSRTLIARGLRRSVATFSRTHPVSRTPAQWGHVRVATSCAYYLPTHSPLSQRPPLRRCLFLDHQIQLGFYLRDAKLQAVKCGDVSGRVAHPALVYLAQLIGGFLWRLHHNTDEPLDGDEVELRNILRSLEYPPDPATLVVIYILLGEYLLFKKQLDIGRQYLIRASQVLPIEDLQLSMPNMSAMLSVDEPDEDTKEYISALAQLSYIDKATSMVLNFPPFLEVEYDRQLKALSVSTLAHMQLSQRPLT